MVTLLIYISLGLIIIFNFLLMYYAFLEQIDNLPSKYKSFLYGFLLTVVSIIITTSLHRFNMFDILEYQLFDYKMKVRGYLSGDLSLAPIPKDAEDFIDLNNNGMYDQGEDYIDIGNEIWDKRESYEDLNNNDIYDEGETFVYKGNGKYD